MSSKPAASKVQIRSGNPLLIAAAGLLAALGGADEFPQDRIGIDTLIAGIAKGPEGEEVWASYEAPNDLPTYLGGFGTWVAPAGEGRLRIRMHLLADDTDNKPASQIWILGPDGSLGDPKTIQGYGVPDAELPASARAELDELDRRRREAIARIPEIERRNKERQNRFRVKHLRGVLAGPLDQDQSRPTISHVALYDTGLILNYLLPRPSPENLDPDDPWAISKTAPRKIELDDGLGTAFKEWGGHVDPNGDGPLRCRREFTPAVPDAASRLVIGLDETSVEIGLRRQ